MLSKFALVNAPGSCLAGASLWLRGGAARAQPDPTRLQVRRSMSDMLPPSQYDATFPNKMKFGTVVINNYEIIPLFAITAFSLTMLFFHIVWATKNKVRHWIDVVYRDMYVTQVLFMEQLKVVYALAIIVTVDVVWETHSRDNISRTMDLEYPTVHKMFIINQRYEPWMEMKNIQAKMHQAARRELSRKGYCKLN